MEATEAPNVMPDFCTVCGDKATKWRYSQYGATSCFSCRTFYRRSVENKAFKKYKCRSKSGQFGECIIDVASRKKCASCRFKKCRQVGMRHGQPHWVKENNDEELDETIDENDNESSESQKGKSPNNQNSKIKQEKQNLEMTNAFQTNMTLAGVPLTSGTYAGVPQAGVPQAGVPQAGVPLTSVMHAGVPHAGVPHAGVPLTSVMHAGVPQQGVLQSGVLQAGVLQAVDILTRAPETIGPLTPSGLFDAPKRSRKRTTSESPDRNSPKQLIKNETGENSFIVSRQSVLIHVEENNELPAEFSDELDGNLNVEDYSTFETQSRNRFWNARGEILQTNSGDSFRSTVDETIFHSIEPNGATPSEQTTSNPPPLEDSNQIHSIYLQAHRVLAEIHRDDISASVFLRTNNIEPISLTSPSRRVLEEHHQERDLPTPRREDLSEEEIEAIHLESLHQITRDPGMNFTFEESLRVASLLQIDCDSRIALRDTLKEFSGSIVKQFLSSVLTGRPLDFSAICWGYACGIQKLTRFAMTLPEFIEATENQNESKKYLLMHNIDPMFNIRNSYFFQSDAPSIICQLERFGIFDLTLLRNLCSTFPLGNIAGVVGPMTWKQYFVTPWADSMEQEVKYEYLMSSLHKLGLNHETTCLLSVVALFSTQDLSQEQMTVPLDNFRRQQYNFSLLLYRYLVHSRGPYQAIEIYPGFMETLGKLREMAEILKNKSIKIEPSPNIEEHLNLFIGCS